MQNQGQGLGGKCQRKGGPDMAAEESSVREGGEYIDSGTVLSADDIST